MHETTFINSTPELQASVQSRQKLQAQRTENVGVQKVRIKQKSFEVQATTDICSQEFDRLKDGESIYKLVGPVLLKQDKVEAEGTVKGRLEFIGKEV